MFDPKRDKGMQKLMETCRKMKTLGKSPLDINLTKWLSRCEGSFHKGKRKRQL